LNNALNQCVQFVCNFQKSRGKHGQNAYFLDLRLEKSNTKHKIWIPWTLLFVPVTKVLRTYRDYVLKQNEETKK
jgi:hypothetical protein